MATDTVQTKKVVILGAGVIGTSIAYHLALKGVQATLIDRAGLCPAASGKAGGFLALDWNDGSPLGPFARRSLQMHAVRPKNLSFYGLAFLHQ
jgi:glycine/D-amino acid oxidase-like deaminating enzyme